MRCEDKHQSDRQREREREREDKSATTAAAAAEMHNVVFSSANWSMSIWAALAGRLMDLLIVFYPSCFHGAWRTRFGLNWKHVITFATAHAFS